MSDLKEWCSVTAVAESCRERFLDLASVTAFEGRARLYCEDRVDEAKHSELVAALFARFDSVSHASDAPVHERFGEELNQINQNAPLKRVERENEPVSGYVWNVLSSDPRFWIDGTCVRKGRFSGIWTGVEFDLRQARKFGVRLISDPGDFAPPPTFTQIVEWCRDWRLKEGRGENIAWPLYRAKHPGITRKVFRDAFRESAKPL